MMILLLAAVFALVRYQEWSWSQTIEKDLNTFEKRAADPDYPFDQLELSAAALQKKYERDFKRLPAFRYAPEKIQLLLEKRRTFELQRRLEAEKEGKSPSAD